MHMNEILNNNGYDYVDLGLPSKTLWATCNIGADKPSDFGLYFQWGDTVGYAKDQIGKDKQFNGANYKWNPSGDGKTFTKYNKTDNKNVLDLEDDAAHANMGGSWHMPTPTQIDELINNTINAWTTQDGVNGRLFTSKKDGTKSIFIPEAGDAWDGSVQGSGDYGLVWSSMLGTVIVDSGHVLRFYSGLAYLYSSRSRYLGCSARGVIDKK